MGSGLPVNQWQRSEIPPTEVQQVKGDEDGLPLLSDDPLSSTLPHYDAEDRLARANNTSDLSATKSRFESAAPQEKGQMLALNRPKKPT